MTAYLAELHARSQIDSDEYEALIPTGAQSAEELYALTLHFPLLVAAALPTRNLAKISALAAQRSTLAFRNAALSRSAAPVVFAHGADQPPNVPFPIGARSSTNLHSLSAGNGTSPPQRIDHHTAWRNVGWPVRDQGQRGTCVAHALAACVETLPTASTAPAQIADRSEQFLYWGAKQYDLSPTDGTLHGHALTALQKLGLCDEALWPYVRLPAGGVVHQGPPPPGAATAALTALHAGGNVAAPSNASALHRELHHGPVAIGVPVFADPSNLTKDNWNVGGLMEYGRVAEPPPMSVVVGGHAVCIVGFEPDAREPAGQGWFIIRNSWGTGIWGSSLPDPRYHAPEPGYGQISWSYVDSYLWELCWLH